MTWVGVTTNIKYLVPSNFYKAFMAPGHLRPTLGSWASCPDNEGKEAVSTGSWNDGHQGRGSEAHSPCTGLGAPPRYLAVSPLPIPSLSPARGHLLHRPGVGLPAS